MKHQPDAASRVFDRVAQLARGAGVGAIATSVDLFTLALLVHAFGVSPRVASVPALSLGVVVQFVGSKLLTFRERESPWGPQALRFLSVEAFAFALNVALFDAAVRALPLTPVVLRLVTTNLVYFGVCLPLWARIFRTREVCR
jgi:putative flippase GtrA